MQMPGVVPPGGDEGDRQLAALREAVAAVVRHSLRSEGGAAPPATPLDTAPLAVLMQQHELLCGAGRELVTPPLLSALHRRVASSSERRTASRRAPAASSVSSRRSPRAASSRARRDDRRARGAGE